MLGATQKSYWWLTLLLLVAIGVRVSYYLLDRSLWLDEAMLVEMIHNREIASWLIYERGQQVAPIGFMLMGKLFGLVLGESDLALRALPLALSIIGVLLTPWAFVFTGTKRVVFLASALLSFAAPLIVYATEYKPYGLDVVLCLGVLAVLQPWFTAVPARTVWVATALAGALAVWCSFPVVFVLAGVGAVVITRLILFREWTGLRVFGACVALWLTSFAVYFFLILRKTHGDDGLMQYHAGAFAPLWPVSSANLKWYLDNFLGLFSFPMGFDFRWLAFCGGLALWGCGVSWRRDPFRCAGMLAPVFVTLLASSLHLYPFTDRCLLFLAPFLAYFIAEGVAAVWEALERGGKMPKIAFAVLCTIPLVLSAVRPMRDFKRSNSYREHNVREMLEVLRRRVSPEDSVFVYRPTIPAFDHYTRVREYGWPAIHRGNAELDIPDGNGNSLSVSAIVDEICEGTVLGKRWVLLSHSSWDRDRRDLLMRLLAEKGVVQEIGNYSGALLIEFTRSRS